MPPLRLPYLICLLDLDNTIIGDVEWVVYEYNLEDYIINNVNRRAKKNIPISKYLKGTPLIRPHFKHFMDTIKKKFGNHIEFFVYTASDDSWANHLIPHVEKAAGVTFNRPFLTRKDCSYDKNSDNYSKSIENVNRIVFKSLKTKYQSSKYTNTVNDRIEKALFDLLIRAKRLMLIDNYAKVLKERDHQLAIKSYDFLYPVDLIQGYDIDDPKVRGYLSKYIFEKNYKDKWDFMTKYHEALHKIYKRTAKTNSDQKDDTMWKDLADSFTKNHDKIKTKSIKEIVKLLS
jgi:hypothetical protein